MELYEVIQDTGLGWPDSFGLFTFEDAKKFLDYMKDKPFGNCCRIQIVGTVKSYEDVVKQCERP